MQCPTPNLANPYDDLIISSTISSSIYPQFWDVDFLTAIIKQRYKGSVYLYDTGKVYWIAEHKTCGHMSVNWITDWSTIQILTVVERGEFKFFCLFSGPGEKIERTTDCWTTPSCNSGKNDKRTGQIQFNFFADFEVFVMDRSD